jgi:predicted PurR-regulated permease PerM
MAPPDQFVKSAWTLASIAVLIAALYLAKGVLVPLTLAVLLSFLLSPICDWLERRRLGRTPAVLATAILGFTLLGAMGWTAAAQMTGLVPKLPEYQANLEARLNSVNEYAVAALSKVTRTVHGMDAERSVSDATGDEPRGTFDQPYSVRVVSAPASPLQVFGGMFGSLLEALGSIGVVVVLVVFFLLRRDDLRDRFIRLVGKGEVTVTTQLLEDASTRVSRYLTMLFVINVTFGLAVSLGLSLIGVPNAMLWGILAMALRFIPYLGPWIAAAMPIGLSLAITTGWLQPCLTVGLFVVLELFSNNVMEPWLYGQRTGVSAVAVLVAAVFWMWLWGPVGLMLATPLTVCLLVVGEHVPQLSFLGILLGNEPVFEPQKRIYQRLLAGDQEEAAELLEDYLEHRPVVEVYDAVLIPALARTETHWQLGELNEGKHKFILQSLRELIEGRGEQRRQLQAAAGNNPVLEADGTTRSVGETEAPKLCILCLPASSEADELASLLLVQVLEASGHLVHVAPVLSTTGALLQLVEQRKPDVVCISATPPSAVMHARSLCKSLCERIPGLTVIVGLWNAHGDLDKAKARIGGGANLHVVATLADAQAQIRQAPLTLTPMSRDPGGSELQESDRERVSTTQRDSGAA